MKKRALCLILMLLMVTFMLPMEANAAYDGNTLADYASSQVGKNSSSFSSDSNWIANHWCAWFVTYCASKVGYASSASLLTDNYFPPIERSTWSKTTPAWAATNEVYEANWLTGNQKGILYYFDLASNCDNNDNCLQADRSSFEPRRGDLVYCNGWGHVGIVTNFNSSNGNVTMVAGNESGEEGNWWQTSRVNEDTYHKSNTYINAYFRPGGQASGTDLPYLDKCTPYQSYVSLQITKDDAWLKSLPCSGGTDPASINVVNSALPIGTKLTGTALYLNDKNNYWYKVSIASGTYAGMEGYVYAGDVSTTLKSHFTYSGKAFPNTLPANKAYDVDWTINSAYLKMDTIVGYIYGGSNYSTQRYSGTINGVNATSRNLQGTAVDNGLRFDLLEPGSYKTVITATATNYYSVDGKTRSSSSVSGTPISFVFQTVGDSAPTTYTVSYNANGGTGAPANQSKTHGTNLTLSTTKPTRASSSAGSYTVTFNANGGSVSPASLSAARTTSYTFKNWNTAANGSGTSYASGATYSTDADVTLYAQWNSSTSTAAISLPTPTRNGYTFKGWATSSTATSGVTGNYTPNGNVTLYAVWIASGTWGNLTWTLDQNGLLTIGGDGWGDPMPDFTENSTQAWRALKNDIISIKSSLATSFGSYAFCDCRNLRTVECTFLRPTNIGANAFRNCISLNSIAGVLDTVQSIGDYAFYQCYSLTSVNTSSSTLSIGKGAFAYCNSLSNVTIANGLEHIDQNAFYSCKKLVNITIPASVTYIGEGNFTYCLNLMNIIVDEANNNYCDLNGILFDKNQNTIIRFPAGRSGSYTIPAGVTSVGDEAFIYCINLSGITMPLGLTSIGTNAFFHCESLSSVVIPSSVTNIGYSAFWACNDLKDVYYSGTQSNWNAISMGADNESLTNATIHYGGTWDNLTWTLDNNGLLTISGNGNMKDISVVAEDAWGPWREQITKVKINNGVTSIGAFAFYNCSKMSEITISSGVNSIGRDAFSYCSSLTSVTMPTGLTSIGFYSFSYCDNLKSVTIPASVTTISANAFIGCGLTDVYYGGTQSQWNTINIGNSNDPLLNAAIHYGCSGTWGSLNWAIDKDGVLTISGNGSMPDFSSKSTDAWRAIKENVIKIVIQNGVTSIGQWSFSDFQNLTSVVLPNSIQSIGFNAFSTCNNLTNIAIPASVISIENMAFQNCSNLTSISVAAGNSTYTSIDGVLFSKNKEKILCVPAGRSGEYQIPSGVKTVGSNAFWNCKKLTSVVIPQSVMIIEMSAFGGCYRLTSISIPEGVKSIGMMCFSSCSNLKNVSIPASIETIETAAFTACPLTDIWYGGAAEQWQAINIGQGNNNLLSATIHYGIVPDLALPSALSTIEDEAFAGGAFTYVQLPQTTESIGWHAFADCPNLVYICIPNAEAVIDPDAFDGVESLTILGKTGSTAQIFAKQHGFIFNPIS